MALLICDSLDQASAPAHLDGPKWHSDSSIFQVLAGQGRFGGKAARLLSGAYLRHSLSSPQSTVIMGHAFKTTANDISQLLHRYLEGNTVHVEIFMDVGGSIYVFRNLKSSGGYLGNTGSIISSGVWHYLESKVTVHDTTGSVEVWLDGVQVLNLTNIDTRNGLTGVVDNVRFYGNSATQFLLDDLYVADTLGSFNNDILGDVRIDNLMPDGDGNYTEFSNSEPAAPSTHWDKVEEIGPDSDTSYNETLTANQRDTFTMGNLPAITSQTIFAIQQGSFAKGTAASPGNMRNILRISGADFNGVALALTNGTYFYLREIWEQDPNAAAAWLESVINGLESGYEDL